MPRLHMLLPAVEIKGFKRFAERTTLRVRGRTLALLEHNESGKTSVLEALAHLGTNGFPAATQFTDRQQRPSSEVILSARVAVEPAEAEAVTQALSGRTYLGGVEEDAVFTVRKYANGERRYLWDSELHRDVSPRGELVEELDRLTGSEWELLPLHAYGEEQQASVRTPAADVRDMLAGQEEEQLGEGAMIALGATAASFTPARRAVIGEGAHEAILLHPPPLAPTCRCGAGTPHTRAPASDRRVHAPPRSATSTLQWRQ